jgi:hypothetical protein
MPISEKMHIVQLTQYSTALSVAPLPFTRNIDCSNYHNLDFIYSLGLVGSTGTIYVEKVATCTGASGDGVNIDFTSRTLAGSCTESSTNYADTWGAITASTGTGVAIATDSSNKVIQISVDLDSLGSGYQAVRLYTLQAANNITNTVFAILSEPRYAGNVQQSVLSDYTSL